MYIDYFYAGKKRIIYKPVPTRITALTDTLTVDDITARTLLPYGLGVELFKEENADIYNHFLGRYRELKAMAMRKSTSNEQDVVDVY